MIGRERVVLFLLMVAGLSVMATGCNREASDELVQEVRAVAAQLSEDAIQREDMSNVLRNSTGSIGTVSNVTKHSEEIERLIGGQTMPDLIAVDENVEDPAVFALEKHLEEFLVRNWQSTELGRDYNIIE